MTAEKGFENAMLEQMNATLHGDKRKAERARTLVQHFKNLMDKRKASN